MDQSTREILAAQASLDQQMKGAVDSYLAGGLQFLDNAHEVLADPVATTAFMAALDPKNRQMLLAAAILAKRQVAIIAAERLKEST